MVWPSLIKGKISIFYFYILLLTGVFILVRRFDRNFSSILGNEEAPIHATSNAAYTLPNAKLTNKNTTLSKRKDYYPLICLPTNTTQTCPKNNYPTNVEDEMTKESNETCPEYFRWIHEDLKQWRDKGITREMVEEGKRVAFFRLVIVEGRVYVETYKKAFQTRDVFTIWGILQLLRMYPGKLPDLDLMFECDDIPVVKKKDYVVAADAPPMFHYCGDDQSYDIPFPDWSFWGWHEINIKPWKSVVEDMKEANRRIKWVDKKPYAYWKGNLRMGRRRYLPLCNSTQHWNAQIYAQHWGIESKRGFRQSNVADQCNHRYKIYMEGKAWSVSEKYIQACNSMLLLVTPRFYEFFTRSMVPLKHYWPINPWRKLCQSIKFSIDWGNSHTEKAEEIANAGHKFIVEELKMKYIYDYMFHLLNEYSKLLRYKPTIPPGAVEMCSETTACNAFDKEKQWKIDTLVKAPSQTSPCSMPAPYDPTHLENILRLREDTYRNVGKWEDSGNVEQVSFIR